MAQIRHKRGDTFDQLLLLPVADYPNGYFLLWDVDSQIRDIDDDTLIDTLTATWASPAADTRTLRLFKADTTNWPLGVHGIDVQFTRQSDNYIRSTETLYLDIVKDITLLPVP